jgi:hypothetical protein
MISNTPSEIVKKYLELHIKLISEIQKFPVKSFENIETSLYKISEKVLDDIIDWQCSSDKYENIERIEQIIISFEQLRLRLKVAHSFHLLSDGFSKEMTQLLISQAVQFGYLLQSND